MEHVIRRYKDKDISEIIDLSLLAWEPVFVAFEQILGPKLYPIAIYSDWRRSHKEAVEKACRDKNLSTWVAEVDSKVIGFITYHLNEEKKVGQVQLLAVHPDNQNHGIGTDLNTLALKKFKENGMNLAVVETGGDDGHATARRSYEKAGYTGLPVVRYFKKL